MIDFSELNQRFQAQKQDWFDTWYDRANTWAEGVSVNDKTVLDLGIGTGLLSKRILKANPAMKLVGVEYDKTYCAKALENLRDDARSITLVEEEEFDPSLLQDHQVTLVHGNIFAFASRFGKNADHLLLGNLRWYSPYKPQPGWNDDPGNQACHINQIAFGTLLKYLAPRVVKDKGNVIQIELLDPHPDRFLMECEQSTCKHYKVAKQEVIGMLKEGNGSIYRPVVLEKTNRLRVFKPDDVVTDRTAELCKDVLAPSYDPATKEAYDPKTGILAIQNTAYRIENSFGKHDDALTVYKDGQRIGELAPIACPLERKCQVYFTEKQI